ncbi:MAG: methyltransferase domain-containing protein [Candidatus Dormibacteria bacterium]
MTETPTHTAAADPDVVYGAEYYHSHCGSIPYTPESPVWLEFYNRVADEIVRTLSPARVFDAGCAVGFLVAALRDRNVEAYGRDISRFAISQARGDISEYCSVGSITAPIEGEFDLILCIEVLEHMPEKQALEAIAVLSRASPRVLFSSTPSDFDEPTHVNVQPTIYWLRHFARAGFAPVVEHDATYLCSHALLLERAEEGRTERDLMAVAEIVRQRIGRDAEAQRAAQLSGRLEVLNEVLDSERAARIAAEAGWQARFDAAELASPVAAARTPPPPRRAGKVPRRLVRAAWWTLTLQLPRRLRDRRAQSSAQIESPVPSVAPVVAEPPVVDASDALSHRFGPSDPLRTYPIPGADRRLNIVIDSIAGGVLHGGVHTTLIIAALLARRLDARLRLVTRTQPPDVEMVKTVLEAQEVGWSSEIEVVHAPPLADESIPVGAGDIFLTTSWWTTRATLQSVPARRVIYLVQEDERMFYPRCDDRLRCSETLARDDLHLLINSELLFSHLAQGPEPLPELPARAHWFEPAFPSRLFYHGTAPQRADGKHHFFFYARPNNLRNLYWRGLEAICAAIDEGVLDPEAWSFTFVGKDIERTVLPGGVTPTVLENLPWDRYAEVVRDVDLGLALMDTPHASYPPLDLAASGAVVVTNTCGLKQSLDRYSRNILAVPAGVEDLCRGLARGVALSADAATRLRNYSQSGIERDWRTTLETTLQRCTTWIEG